VLSPSAACRHSKVLRHKAVGIARTSISLQSLERGIGKRKADAGRQAEDLDAN
jgi:hypothetical protein